MGKAKNNGRTTSREAGGLRASSSARNRLGTKIGASGWALIFLWMTVFLIGNWVPAAMFCIGVGALLVAQNLARLALRAGPNFGWLAAGLIVLAFGITGRQQPELQIIWDSLHGALFLDVRYFALFPLICFCLVVYFLITGEPAWFVDEWFEQAEAAALGAAERPARKRRRDA